MGELFMFCMFSGSKNHKGILWAFWGHFGHFEGLESQNH
jgi:hypothetical protein